MHVNSLTNAACMLTCFQFGKYMILQCDNLDTVYVCAFFRKKNYQLTKSPIFSARCNIYISRLFYDVSVRLSVHLSVTFTNGLVSYEIQ